MKPLLLFIALCGFFISIESCSESSAKEKTPRYEAPQALEQNNKTDFSLISKSSTRNNLVEEIYAELMEKDAILKKLDDDIKLSEKNLRSAANAFNEFNGKSANYYDGAFELTLSIKDSSVKKEMITVIEASKKSYEGKTSTYQNLLKLAELKSLSENDYYKLLKLVKTLPVIEDYQTQRMPDKAMAQQAVTNFDAVINKTKELSKKK